MLGVSHQWLFLHFISMLFEFSLACSGFVTYLSQDYLFQQDLSRFSVIIEQIMKHVSGHLTILLNNFSVLAVSDCVASAHHANKSQARWLIKLRICKSISTFSVLLHFLSFCISSSMFLKLYGKYNFNDKSACLLLWSKKGDVWIKTHSTIHPVCDLTGHSYCFQPSSSFSHRLSFFVCLQVKLWDVHKASGSVMMETVSLMSGDVMELETVWMDLMKWIVLVGIPPVFPTQINGPNY